MFTYAENVRVDGRIGYLATNAATYADGNLQIAEDGQTKRLQLSLLGISTTGEQLALVHDRWEAWCQAVDQAEILICENGHWDYPSSADEVRRELVDGLLTGYDSRYYVAAFRVDPTAQPELYLAKYGDDPIRYYKVRFRIIPREVLLRLTPTQRHSEIKCWGVHLTKRKAPRVREYIGTEAGDEPDCCRDWLFAAMTDGWLPVRHYTGVWPLTPLQF